MRKKGIILISVIFSLLILTFVSGISYDWTEYGIDGSQAQDVGATSLFNVSPIGLYSVGVGQAQYNHPTQPLVSDLGISDNNFLIVVDGSYIKVYNKSLDFVTSIALNESSIGQLGIADWDGDGYEDDIAGFFRESSTSLRFKVYSFNQTSSTLSTLDNVNFTYPATNGVSGVRCFNRDCFTVVYNTSGGNYTWQSFHINQTGSDSYVLYSPSSSDAYYPLEPPSFTDYNSDGVLDFLIFSEERVTVYNENGVVIRTWNYTRTSSWNEYVRDAKFYNDGGTYWKVAVLFDVPYDSFSALRCGNAHPPNTYSCAVIQANNIIDGSNIFEDTPVRAIGSTDNPRAFGLAVADYDGDGYDDLWTAGARLNFNKNTNVTIYDGSGTVLVSEGYNWGFGSGASYPNSQITVGGMDNDGDFDMIIYANGEMVIYNPTSDVWIYNDTLSTISGQGTCIPADLTFNGYLDAVCSDVDSVELFSANFTNDLPSIDTLIFNPSTSVIAGTTVYVTINASDTESNQILYRHRCSESEAWSTEDSVNIKSCYYGSVGSYVLTVGVRDIYHGYYNTYSQVITVSSSGDVIQADGGIALPTELVSTEDINSGLLPSIYYGTLAFMSNVLNPLIIIVFVILFVMIILTFGVIIRKIAVRVANIRG